MLTLLEDTRGMDRLEDGRVLARMPQDHVDLTGQVLPHWPTSLPPVDGRVGWWLHPDDLGVETSPLAGEGPVSIAAFTCCPESAREGLSERRVAALHTSLRVAADRAGRLCQAPTTVDDAPSLAEGLAAWVEAENLDAVMAMAPTVGPVAEALPDVRAALARRKVVLHLVRRAWDSRLFPLAGKGFFPFWEKTARWLPQQFSRGDR